MANSCSSALAGIAYDCAPSMGGVKRVLIANAEDVGEISVESDKVTAITMVLEAKFKEYKFRSGVASLVSTMNKSLENGTTFFANVLTLQFNRMETSKAVEMKALSYNNLVVIVEDNNGLYWLLGEHEPVMASGGESGTGAARGDANKYGITLTDNSPYLPHEVDASIIAGLVSVL